MEIRPEELTDKSLELQALYMICELFNDGIIPSNSSSRLHGIATLFANWGKDIRDSSKKLVNE